MIDDFDYSLRLLKVMVDWLNKLVKEDSPHLSQVAKMFRLPEGTEIKDLKKECEIYLLSHLCTVAEDRKSLVFDRWYSCLNSFNKENDNKYQIILKRDEKIELPRATPLERVSTALRLLTDEEYEEVRGQFYLLLCRLFSKGENDDLEHRMDNQYPATLPYHRDVADMGNVFDKDVS